jgi:hypothetical protein
MPFEVAVCAQKCLVERRGPRAWASRFGAKFTRLLVHAQALQIAAVVGAGVPGFARRVKSAFLDRMTIDDMGTKARGEGYCIAVRVSEQDSGGHRIGDHGLDDDTVRAAVKGQAFGYPNYGIR